VLSSELLQRLRERGDALTPTEVRIASHLFDNRLDAAFLPASRFAEAVGVSESSVLRFARSAGYDNYHELQQQVQDEIRHHLTARSPDRLERAVDAEKGAWDYFRSALSIDVTNVGDTLTEASRDEFEAIIAALNGARRVYVVGLRGAAAVAQLLGYTLNLLLDDVRPLIRADLLPDGLLTIDERDVLIACAFARHARGTMQAVQVARGSGATVVGITDDPLSPLALASDRSLIVATRSHAFIQSYTASVSVVHGLLAAIGAERHDRALSRLERLETNVQLFDTYVRGQEE
jgi:DNA-binding MurR/RpiR family transcriptional regulator